MPGATREEKFQLFRDCVVNGLLKLQCSLEDMPEATSMLTALLRSRGIEPKPGKEVEALGDLYVRGYRYLLSKWEEVIDEKPRPARSRRPQVKGHDKVGDGKRPVAIKKR